MTRLSLVHGFVTSMTTRLGDASFMRLVVEPLDGKHVDVAQRRPAESDRGPIAHRCGHPVLTTLSSMMFNSENDAISLAKCGIFAT